MKVKFMKVKFMKVKFKKVKLKNGGFKNGIFNWSNFIISNVACCWIEHKIVNTIKSNASMSKRQNVEFKNIKYKIIECEQKKRFSEKKS